MNRALTGSESTEIVNCMALQILHFDLDTVARPQKLASRNTYLVDFIAFRVAHLSGSFDANRALKGGDSGSENSPYFPPCFPVTLQPCGVSA